MSMNTYKLSATLTAHSSDVRALCAPTPDLVISGSRDTTAIAWKRAEGTDEKHWAPTIVFRASGGYVGSVAYLPPTSDAPQGYAVVGGQDAVINIYNIATGSSEPERALLGHTGNVCSLGTGSEDTVISGSWDNSAKVWKDFQLLHDLKGHTASVWAVLCLGNDEYLTGSADKTIKHWVGNRCKHTYEGHTDVVRGISLITDIGFASCSNGGDIIIWTIEGDLVHTLSGHTSFVYALTVLPNGDMVSSGEDRTVRVWHDFENSQTIVHPAISVWTVSAMPNGDIVSGCSDGVVRIFSASSERWASAEDLKEYDATVASQARPAQEMENMKTSDPSVLSQPGTKPGQTVMVKNAQTGTIEAHQWDAQAHQWQKIGDVVDAVGSGRRQLYEGKEYDYVFDIDVKEGAPALKLPYNVSENPYTAAQRFLERNDLPVAYLDQVADFITKNTQGTQLGGGGGYVDPYTGATRYQPSSSSVPAAGSYQDPYTGASRYSGASGGPASPTSGSYRDPYTGGTRYTPGGSSAQPPRVPQLLPVRTPIPFKTANIPKMQAKIEEFSEQYRDDAATSALAISQEEKARFDELYAALSGRSSVTSAHLDTLIAVLNRWPLDRRWPLFDLARLIASSCTAAVASYSRVKFVRALCAAADWSGSWQSLTPQRNTTVGLVLRAAANALIDASAAEAAEILATVGSAPYVALNKSARGAFAAMLVNFSIVGLSSPIDASARSKHLYLVTDVLQKEPSRHPEDASDRVPDPEAVYRALVSVGNVVQAAKTYSQPLDPMEAQQIRMRLSGAGGMSDPRIATVISDTRLLMQ